MLFRRPRRNRKTPAIRSLVAETTLLPTDLIAPFFVIAGDNRKEAIPTLPGIDRLSKDLILKEAAVLHQKGIAAIALFPVIPADQKDEQGSEALNENGLVPETIRLLKRELPELCLITDIALDAFTSHGHDGLVNHNSILNDETVEILCKTALLHAACGVDIVAPSDMMDGRVGAIRRALDAGGFQDVSILSYTAKYASNLYGPYRDALGSKLKFGDKKTYQMNPSNVREALLETHLDEQEGADILMLKPALFYLDVLCKMRERTTLPLCAFHVSGEYAMVMAAEAQGMLKADPVFLEALLSIKRAGADCIISYAAPRVLEHLINQQRIH
jgi:porphobilinogen synthase